MWWVEWGRYSIFVVCAAVVPASALRLESEANAQAAREAELKKAVEAPRRAGGGAERSGVGGGAAHSKSRSGHCFQAEISSQ